MRKVKQVSIRTFIKIEDESNSLKIGDFPVIPFRSNMQSSLVTFTYSPPTPKLKMIPPENWNDLTDDIKTQLIRQIALDNNLVKWNIKSNTLIPTHAINSKILNDMLELVHVKKENR